MFLVSKFAPLNEKCVLQYTHFRKVIFRVSPAIRFCTTIMCISLKIKIIVCMNERMYGSKLLFCGIPGEDSSKNIHHAGPGHTIPTAIHRLPVHELFVTKRPFTVSSMPPEIYSKGETNYPFLLLTTMILSPQFKSHPYHKVNSPHFGFSLCRWDHSKTSLNLFLD